MDIITNEITVDTGGDWTGPDNWSSIDYCGPFTPSFSKEGKYTYSTETDGCVRKSHVNVVFNDFGNPIPDILICGPENINLYDEICIPNEIPLNGVWFYPNNPNNPFLEEVSNGIITTQTDSEGVYVYLLRDENQCITKSEVKIFIEPSYPSGIETWVEVCPEQDQICLYELLNGTPRTGGQWLINDINGNFIDFFVNYDACLESSFSTVDLTCSYILSSTACEANPENTELHIHFLEAEGCLNSDIELNGIYLDALPTCEIQNTEIWIYDAASNGSVFYTNTPFNNGQFSTMVNLPVASYNVSIKINGFLSKVFENINFNTDGVELEIGELIKGDLNGDDGINILDVSIINVAFGSTIGDENFDIDSDLNCDGGINILDISKLNLGFNLVGDHLSNSEN